MANSNIFIFLLTGAMNVIFAIDYKYLDFNNVISTDMFNDYTVTSDGVNFKQNIFLVYKTKACENIVTYHGLSQHVLPPPQHCFLLTYDYLESPKHVWYKQDVLLTDRYPVEGCPTVYLFPKGSSVSDKPVKWDWKETFTKWSWRQLEKAITLVNKLDGTLNIEIQTNGPFGNQDIKISAFETKLVKVYPSDFILVFDKNNDFINGHVVYDSMNIVIDNSFVASDDKAFFWKSRILKVEQNKAASVVNWALSTADRNMCNLKQPFIVPKFSPTGYQKLQTPSKVQSMLIDHYQRYEAHRVIEEALTETDSIVNTDEFRSSIIDLNLNTTLKELIAREMLPVVEGWCNCKLEMTFFYGIREYYKGHILRRHVDRVATHVISTIFQIRRDLDGQPNWPLEVIGYDGVKKHMYLEEGEMLLYESAKLVHARPTPFEGKVFANSFLHYRPYIPVWPFKHDVARRILIDERNGHIEYTMQEDSPLMNNARDAFSRSMHDEL